LRSFEDATNPTPRMMTPRQERIAQATRRIEAQQAALDVPTRRRSGAAPGSPGTGAVTQVVASSIPPNTFRLRRMRALKAAREAEERRTQVDRLLAKAIKQSLVRHAGTAKLQAGWTKATREAEERRAKAERKQQSLRHESASRLQAGWRSTRSNINEDCPSPRTPSPRPWAEAEGPEQPTTPTTSLRRPPSRSSSRASGDASPASIPLAQEDAQQLVAESRPLSMSRDEAAALEDAHDGAALLCDDKPPAEAPTAEAPTAEAPTAEAPTAEAAEAPHAAPPVETPHAAAPVQRPRSHWPAPVVSIGLGLAICAGLQLLLRDARARGALIRMVRGVAGSVPGVLP